MAFNLAFDILSLSLNRMRVKFQHLSLKLALIFFLVVELASRAEVLIMLDAVILNLFRLTLGVLVVRAYKFGLLVLLMSLRCLNDGVSHLRIGESHHISAMIA